MADAVHRNFLLFHNLQKCRLCLGRSPVNLICQKQVAHHASRLILKCSAVFFVHGKSSQIRRHDVRRKLYAVLRQRHGVCQCHGKRCLTHTGDIVQQNMSSCQNCRYRFQNTVVFSNYRLLYFLNDYICGCLILIV